MDHLRLRKLGLKIFTYTSKSWQEAHFNLRMSIKKLDYVLEGHSNLLFWLYSIVVGVLESPLLLAFQWVLKLCDNHKNSQRKLGLKWNILLWKIQYPNDPQLQVANFGPNFLSFKLSKWDNLSAYQIENFLNFSKHSWLLILVAFLCEL